MPHARVLSFMSQWSASFPKSPIASAPATPPKSPALLSESPPPLSLPPPRKTDSPPRESIDQVPESPNPAKPNAERRHSRRSSMIMAYQPPVMQIAEDTPPELQPIFTHLNNHSNKLYQEGYFLKLHDLDSRGRPSADRVWTECFAQLVGTVLSLWDAAQLDAAGEDGEVMPTFINLTDASIKMIESLPMNSGDGQTLQNVLSISTAANNRYLFHFNSLHSLTQWTAGIRLAMYEHSTLQEAYTGSIIAGKGKGLNNIKTIMERSRFPTEDWARVRFGAGTPWRRCWCVITPPDEKELAKAAKQAKKRSAYEKAPVVKGDIKFYETRKVTKKTKPIATIKDAYTAYAIYPQAKELIDQSTLVKVDGQITIHTSPETVTDGFVFVMPEVHPAVTGFEILFRWLIPCFDAFALYGRPTRLIADVMDVRSLMFAMPNGHRYGYLDLIDVAGLIHTEGSTEWNEREWRKQLKNLTSRRMSTPNAPNRTMSNTETAPTGPVSRAGAGNRASLNLAKPPSISFAGTTPRSQPGSRQGSPPRTPVFADATRNASDTALVQARTSSEARRPGPPGRTSFDIPSSNARQMNGAPRPPAHGIPPDQFAAQGARAALRLNDKPPGGLEPPTPPQHQMPASPVLSDFGDTQPKSFPTPPLAPNESLKPVAAPPSMAHRSNAQPPRRPNQMPDMRKANQGMDAATIAQLQDANPAGRYINGNHIPPRDESQLYRPVQSYQNSPPGPYGMPQGSPQMSQPPPRGASHGPPPGMQSRPPPQGPPQGYNQGRPQGPPQGSPPYGMGPNPGPGGPPPGGMRRQNSPHMNMNLGGPPPQDRYGGPPDRYGSPDRYAGGPPPQDRQMSNSRLATIPGTPAGERENFDLPPQQPSPNQRPMQRKPVGAAPPAYGPGPGQGQGQGHGQGQGYGGPRY